jgi:hypothetical protein
MIAVLLFLAPAIWLSYLVGLMIRQGLAVMLYHHLNDLTPWLIDHHTQLVNVALTLGVAGNLLITIKSYYFKWQRTLLAYPLVFGGGTLWLAACLVAPGWWLGLFGGMVMFVAMTMMVLAATVAHFAMREDEIFEVLAWVVGALAVVACLHLGLHAAGAAV